MKNRSSGFLICLITVAALSSCQSVKEPELRGIGNARVQHLGLLESSLRFEILFFNPNNYRLKIKDASGDAWLDDQLLGHFTVDTLVHVPALGEFRLPVELKMDMSHFLENISAAFTDKQVTLKMEGMARAGKGLFFINYPIQYEGKQKLSELLK